MNNIIIQNIGTSIRQRLLNLARKTNRPFDEILQYFIIERFLYRLSLSQFKDKFILKGALMFHAWNLVDSRATRDIDFLGVTANQESHIKKIINEICQIDCLEDGIKYIWEDIQCKKTQKNNEYSGIRANFFAELAKAKIKIQIDIGFGDIVYPKPLEFNYPTLLKMDSPRVQGYTPETVIAEKLHTMIRYGLTNSRMKDIFDVWLLSRQFSFEGEYLSRAIMKTFSNRSMAYKDMDFLLFSEYKSNTTKNQQWNAFIIKNKLPIFPDTFTEAITYSIFY